VTSLREYVEAWRATCADLSALAAELAPSDWALPTDCPGWSVHDVLAHCLAIESELAGDPRPEVPVDLGSAHLVGPSNIYAERGVEPRRGLTSEQLRAEFDDTVERRAAQLEQAAGAQPTDRPDLTPGGIDWDWETLLRNRTIDIWVHQQDIRRAVGQPGGLDSPGARVTQETFASALPFIVAKRAEAPGGSTAVFDVTGPLPAVYGVVVDASGRGHAWGPGQDEPTVRLTMTTEELTVLGAGRRAAETLGVTVSGDLTLADRILANMALTV
jgi:uncharacterized protein (TIGR03083 family)